MSDKNYEIIAYRHKPTTTALSKDVVVYPDSKHWETAVNNEDNEYEIYSIGRLSDNEIFHIGNAIGPHDIIEQIAEDSRAVGGAVLRSGTSGTAINSAVRYFGENSEKVDKSVHEKEETILEIAQKLIYGDRQEQYGSVTDNFNNIARMWSVIMKTEVTAEQVGLAMIAVKICRYMNKPGVDSEVDIAGYAGTLEKLRKGQ